MGSPLDKELLFTEAAFNCRIPGEELTRQVRSVLQREGFRSTGGLLIRTPNPNYWTKRTGPLWWTTAESVSLQANTETRVGGTLVLPTYRKGWTTVLIGVWKEPPKRDPEADATAKKFMALADALSEAKRQLRE